MSFSPEIEDLLLKQYELYKKRYNKMGERQNKFLTETHWLKLNDKVWVISKIYGDKRIWNIFPKKGIIKNIYKTNPIRFNVQIPIIKDIFFERNAIDTLPDICATDEILSPFCFKIKKDAENFIKWKNKESNDLCSPTVYCMGQRFVYLAKQMINEV